MIDITEMEKLILKCGCESEYEDFTDEPTWTFSVIDNSGLKNKARGVISSLVKKGLVEVSDWDGTDSVIEATEAGKTICKELGYTQ